MAHMSQVVEPRMRGLFQTFDSTRFRTFGCATCHGQAGSDRAFAMPSPDLPALDPTFFYRKHRKSEPEVAHFMWKTVEPTMAKLLGLPRGKTGVHCGTCHRLQP